MQRAVIVQHVQPPAAGVGQGVDDLQGGKDGPGLPGEGVDDQHVAVRAAVRRVQQTQVWVDQQVVGPGGQGELLHQGHVRLPEDF